MPKVLQIGLSAAVFAVIAYSFWQAHRDRVDGDAAMAAFLRAKCAQSERMLNLIDEGRGEPQFPPSRQLRDEVRRCDESGY